MPRPTKCRLVCNLPQINTFGPYDNMCEDKPFILMSIEEFETIRLIDYENMTQEACAEKMGIARTTVQRIYTDARAKLAKALVECKKLNIDGGNFKICKKDKPHCHHDKCLKKGDNFMIIAVATEKNMVSEHFGHCESFTFFQVEDKKIVNHENTPNPKSGHGSLAEFLKDKNVSVVISGGMGEGAFNGLKSVGIIDIITGATGETEQAVLQYLAGDLVSKGVNCGSHKH